MVKQEAVVLAVFSMVLIGLADFLRKRAMASGVEPASFMVIESSFVFLSAVAAVILLSGSLRVTGTTLSYAPICGFLILISMLSMLFALRMGEASVIVPIARLGFTVTFILAVLLTPEALTAQKILGILFAVAAVILLSR